MDKEKRIYPRTQVQWSVSGMTNSGMIQGKTQNISLNGAFICCEKTLPPNEIFLLTVNGPVMFEIPRLEAVDIDNESDFQIANILMKMRMENQ